MSKSTSGSRLRRFGVAALAVTVAAGLTTGAYTAWADDYEPVEHAVFTDPNGGDEGHRALANELMGLIAHADEGSTVQLAVYRFKDTAIADELVAAADRGVDVRVLVPDRSTDKINVNVRAILEDGLGRDNSSGSYITYCSPTEEIKRNPCISSSSDGLMHSKFATFSSVSGKKDIVFVSSGNLNLQTYWNNAVVAVERPVLYGEYSGYFEDLELAERASDNYGAERPDADDGPFRSYFFPRSDRNIFVDVLDNADCSATGLPTESGRTEINIAVLIFTDRAVVDKLRQMGAAGCEIKVAYMDSWVSDYVDDALQTAASEGSIESWYVPDTPEADKKAIHSKYLTIEGVYYNDNVRKLVWAGSLNYSEKAQRIYDETVIRIEDDTFFAGYHDNFETIISGPADQIQKN